MVKQLHLLVVVAVLLGTPVNKMQILAVAAVLLVARTVYVAKLVVEYLAALADKTVVPAVVILAILVVQLVASQVVKQVEIAVALRGVPVEEQQEVLQGAQLAVTQVIRHHHLVQVLLLVFLAPLQLIDVLLCSVLVVA